MRPSHHRRVSSRPASAAVGIPVLADRPPPPARGRRPDPGARRPCPRRGAGRSIVVRSAATGLVVVDRPIVRLAELHRVGMGEVATAPEEAAPIASRPDRSAGRSRRRRAPCGTYSAGSRRRPRQGPVGTDHERPGVFRLTGQHHLEVGGDPQSPGRRRMVPDRQQVDAQGLVRGHEDGQFGLERALSSCGTWPCRRRRTRPHATAAGSFRG